MSDNDYYRSLGVSRNASADDIRQAYKKLSRKFHPDRNPENDQAADQFKEVQEAYEVLGDEQTRQQYDRFGPAFRQAAGGAGPGGPFPGGMPQGVDLESLFSGGLGGGIDLASLFGNRGDRAGPSAGPQTRRGQDHSRTIRIAFQVAAGGGNHELDVRKDGPEGPSENDVSGGAAERLSLKIPAGIASGEVLRLKGQGGRGAGGPDGDLLVTVQVAPHPWFRRDGDDLLLDLPVTPAEAALGAKVDVPTLDEQGTVVLTVPPGTSSGARLRLLGQGISNARTGKQGDQYCVVKIVVGEVKGELRDAYRQLGEVDESDPRAGKW